MSQKESQRPMAAPLLKPTSIYEITQLEESARRAALSALIPQEMLALMDPPLRGPLQEDERFKVTCAEKWGLVEIHLRARADDRDPLIFVELSDMAFGQVDLGMIIINDPNSERFDIDVTPDGTPTYLGTAARNIAEEERAMKAGLAPGQVRRGLRMFKKFLPLLERFVDSLGKEVIIVDALTYNSTLLYEKYGFGYVGGGQILMERINRDFQPGGRLWRKLDGSTPFRQPGAHATIRGRSWAIHDGILNGGWEEPRMFKRVFMHAGIVTFPGAQY